MAQLVVTNGSDVGTLYILGDEAVLGRHSTTDIVVRDLAASRRHAKITRASGGYFLEDLGSHNGTLVNNEKIKRCLLKDGANIRIGDCVFIFHDDMHEVTGSHSVIQTGVSSGEKQPPDYSDHHSVAEDIHSMEMMGVEEVSKASKPLALLYELSHAVASFIQLDDLLPAMLGRIFEAFPQTHRGLVMIQGTDSEGLQVRCVKKRFPEDKGEVTISRSVFQKVLNRRLAVLTHNLKPHPLAEDQQKAPREMCCVVAVPLVHKDQLLGLIYLETWDQEHLFTREDLRLVASLVPEATIAIQNARTHEQAVRLQLLRRDLEIAARVQEEFLPRELPSISGYEFVTHYDPPQEISGDYFDFIPIPGGDLAVVVADVSGKGVSAGLLMAKLSSEARFCILTHEKLTDAFGALNRTLKAASMEVMFVTFVCVRLSPRAGRVTLANAGHPPPILHRASGETQLMDAAVGIPLGIKPDFQYEQQVFKLEGGDSLLLYTDGIFDASNVKGDAYGTDRLLEVVKRAPSTPQGITDELLDDLNSFITGTPQRDDMTFVCFGRKQDTDDCSTIQIDDSRAEPDDERTRDSGK